ncbi:hypothetical protein ScPMuIL_016441 [Solemya velum]
MGLLPMKGTYWPGGGACLPALEMAIDDVNSRADILNGYDLNLTWMDSMCIPGLATDRMYAMLYNPPTKLVIVGAACSHESEATAQSSHLWNVTQISYGSSSPLLSDRQRFPKFFRVTTPDTEHNIARISLMRRLGWKRIATIHESLDFFSAVTDNLIQQVKDLDIEIMAAEIFDDDPTTQVENLKVKDARIIVAGCYPPLCRLLLCTARKGGLYGPRIVWFFPGWFNDGWWKVDPEQTGCTFEEMLEAAEGLIATSFFYWNPLEERGVANITSGEFRVLYDKKLGGVHDYLEYEIASPLCYDTIWATALALNLTIKSMADAGIDKTLDEFTYQDGYINDILTSSFYNISFTGVRGHIAFSPKGDSITATKLEFIKDGELVYAGYYDRIRSDWVWGGGIQWRGGVIPRDSTIVIVDQRFLSTSLFASMCTFAAIGMFLVIMFFVFNVAFRHNRTVKMSSPNINNILLCGCILAYTTVFLHSPHDDTARLLCKIKTFTFTVGFSLVFGALFSKTWRVHRIFANKKMQKMRIKDSQLFGFIGVLLCVDICVLVVWETIDPQYIMKYELPKEISLTDNDVEYHPEMNVCTSKYSSYFTMTLYIIQGALMAFGAFLSWETRKVKIEALNDSRLIGMCIYNVVVLSALGLTLSIVLEDQVELMYAFISGFTIIGTTMTQLIIFIPKVFSVITFTRLHHNQVIPLTPANEGQRKKHPLLRTHRSKCLEQLLPDSHRRQALGCVWHVFMKHIPW